MTTLSIQRQPHDVRKKIDPTQASPARPNPMKLSARRPPPTIEHHYRNKKPPQTSAQYRTPSCTTPGEAAPTSVPETPEDTDSMSALYTHLTIARQPSPGGCLNPCRTQKNTVPASRVNGEAGQKKKEPRSRSPEGRRFTLRSTAKFNHARAYGTADDRSMLLPQSATREQRSIMHSLAIQMKCMIIQNSPAAT